MLNHWIALLAMMCAVTALLILVKYYNKQSGLIAFFVLILLFYALIGLAVDIGPSQ